MTSGPKMITRVSIVSSIPYVKQALRTWQSHALRMTTSINLGALRKQMKAIEADAIEQNSATVENELPCVECGNKDHAMVLIRMHPKNEVEHPRAIPLGGTYCTLCAIKFSIELSTACLKAARLN
jgi:hypothetical protein